MTAFSGYYYTLDGLDDICSHESTPLDSQSCKERISCRSTYFEEKSSNGDSNMNE